MERRSLKKIRASTGLEPVPPRNTGAMLYQLSLEAIHWERGQFIEFIYIVYVIESAAYGFLFTSCLCQKPERARYERVRAFDTNNE